MVAVGLVTGLVKKYLPTIAAAFVPSAVFDTVASSIISDKASEAFDSGQGICVSVNVSLEGGWDVPIVRIIPAKTVEDYASGKVKHPNA